MRATIHKPQFFPAIFSSPPRPFRQLEFVYSDTHVSQIAFLDWLTPSLIVNEFYKYIYIKTLNILLV